MIDEQTPASHEVAEDSTSSNKVIIYQVLPRLFGNRNTSHIKNGTLSENGTGKFSDFTPDVLSEIKKLGITHIWYTGVIEHASTTDYTSFGIHKCHHAVVKGEAGSPFAIIDYYDVDPDLADDVMNRMQEFQALVTRTHEASMKVIIDFVPNHVARQYSSDVKPYPVNDLGFHDDVHKTFDPNNNFYYLPGESLVLHFGAQLEDFEYSEFPAKVTGNNCFRSNPSKNDWYETIKLNYGVDYANDGACYFDPVPDTWHKMLEILLFWKEKGVDGFRCDMAEMVPIEFWHWVIPQVKAGREVCFIGEVYNPAAYRDFISRGGFDYLYDKVGLYDTLRAVICEWTSTDALTRCWQTVDGIQSHMVHFLENHDEQRIASDFFVESGERGYPGMIVAATMNTNPVMIYFGQEFGEQGMNDEGFSGLDGRTTIFDYWSLPCIQHWINGGKLDGALLTSSQKKLFQAYTKLLNIAGSEPAIGHGQFFDLMYVNPHLSTAGNRLYAFLRSYKQEVILIVVNFNNVARTVNINIPPEAFRQMNIPDNKAATMTNLLTDKQSISTLTVVCPFQVSVPPHSGSLLKFDFQLA
ncbi:MAG: alpha-amylase [Tannerella sp.]|nr:alpha-amylase [Tannerella sp.]